MNFGTEKTRTEKVYLYSSSNPIEAEATVMYDLENDRVTGNNTNKQLVGRSTLRNVPLKSEATASRFSVESVEIDGVVHYYWDKPGE